MEKVPYQTVLIHGIIRDRQGRKMSKSLGNVIDPLDLFNEFGADAVRMALAQSAAPGRDMQLSRDNFIGMRNFSNKIWNATRFSLMNLDHAEKIHELKKIGPPLELADRWILHRFFEVIQHTTEAMQGMDIDAAARGLYDFFWSDFCDWYLEMIKPRMDRQKSNGEGANISPRQTAQSVLATVLEGTLRMLHPFMPFLTEELWQKIPKPASTHVKHLMATTWPKPQHSWKDPEAAEKMSLLQEVVTKIRAIRSEMGIPSTQPVELIINSSDQRVVSLLKEQEAILRSLNSRVGTLTINTMADRPKASAAAVVPHADLYVPLEGLIDFAKERARLEKELTQVRQEGDRLRKKLSNQDFVTHAPPEEIQKAKDRFEEAQQRLERLEENIATLS
jgi:valyl-tRNA synthetase